MNLSEEEIVKSLENKLLNLTARYSKDNKMSLNIFKDLLLGLKASIIE